MNNPYFLTRQTANLMEDFTREIGRGSSLFLLYGEPGAGKSRLLRQLEKTRLQDQVVHYLDFDSQPADGLEETIREITESASEGDVIIFDHYEAASNRSQHKVFESWATDGRDRHLNIIVCASSAGFSQFRQLAQRFQIEAKSFQLMPCNQEECEAFIHTCLYPEQPLGKLEIPATLKHTILQSGGLYSRLTEIVERDGASIAIKEDIIAPTSPAPTIIILSLVLIIGVVGVLYYYSNIPTPLDIPVVTPISEPETITKVVKEEPVNIAEIAVEPLVEPVSKPVPVPEVVPEPVSNGLKRRLQTSLDWIHNSKSSQGTIQLMSIAVSRFDNRALEKYLDDLENQGIDITQVRIFKGKAAGKSVYGLIYGDFVSRKEAKSQISRLPEAVRADKPIPRSAGGIAKEIAR